MYQFDIVFLVSHSKEVPSCMKHFMSVISINSLLANDTRKLTPSANLICIITGVGFSNNQKCLLWIRDKVITKLIVNIGSCGSTNISFLNKLICPNSFKFSSSIYYGLGVFPFFVKQNIENVQLCESVLKPDISIDSDFVDMEAFWQAEFCNQQNIYFTSLKYVTDLNNSNTDIFYNKNLKNLQHTFNNIFYDIFSKLDNAVSVIIPTFNRASFLKRSIDSVLAQSVKTECIVVDDCSVDETKSILSSYGNAIKIIYLDQNLGVSSARNKGILSSSYPWISFLDSDDMWKPNKLEKQLNYLSSHPYFSIIQSQEHWIRNHKLINKKKHYLKSSGYIWENALKRCVISPSSVLVKKDIFYALGFFDEKLRVCEDYDLWLRFTRSLLIGLEDTYSLIKYAGHKDQLSENAVAIDRFRVYALKKALSNEYNLQFKNKLELIINKKENILSKGKSKRKDNSIYDIENLLCI